MLRIASSALDEVGALWREVAPPPLLLALPDDGDDELAHGFLGHLQRQASAAFALSDSRLFPRGRAGGLVALAQAREMLASGRFSHVCVGGVDTYLDAALLASLEDQRRLHCDELRDGFIPGEGAAFLWICASERRRVPPCRPLAELVAVGLGFEPGHPGSEAPLLGDGLADAVRFACSQRPIDVPRIRHVYAGLNGEYVWSKAWGIAAIRNSAFFAPELSVEHISDRIGDAGAATAPMMLAMASIGLCRGYRPSPTLVWCASDHGDCGAAILQQTGLDVMTPAVAPPSPAKPL